MVLNRNKGEPDFIITNKEEQVLQKFRELSNEDQKEVYIRFIELALQHVNYG